MENTYEPNTGHKAVEQKGEAERAEEAKFKAHSKGENNIASLIKTPFAMAADIILPTPQKKEKEHDYGR